MIFWKQTLIFNSYEGDCDKNFIHKWRVSKHAYQLNETDKKISFKAFNQNHVTALSRRFISQIRSQLLNHLTALTLHTNALMIWHQYSLDTNLMIISTTDNNPKAFIKFEKIEQFSAASQKLHSWKEAKKLHERGLFCHTAERDII